MTASVSAQTLTDRAKKIDPCAFKSYSGSSRREAQQQALAQAARELAAEGVALASTIKCARCGWSFTPPLKGGCDHRDCEYIAQPRRYSLAEIDRMRAAIRRVQPFRGFSPGGEHPNRIVEDQLRTAMLGGVDPRELEDKADEHWAAMRERRRQRELAADEAPTPIKDAAEEIVRDIPPHHPWRGTLIARIEAAILRFGRGARR